MGDDGARVAMPFLLLPGDNAVARLAELVKREGIDAFVVGLPIPTEAHQSEAQLERTVSFINQLSDVTKLPVQVVDEQFSSAEARRVQAEYGATASEDEIAAMLILQAFFDEQVRVQK